MNGAGDEHRDAWTGKCKVMHIIAGLDVGGAEGMLERLVRANSDAISDSVVVSLTSVGVIGASLRGRGVRVHALGMTSLWSVPTVFFKLVGLIRGYRPQIVQTWMYHADLLGGVAARLSGCHSVVWGIRTTHLPDEGSRVTRQVRRLCARLSGWVPQRIVCAAEASRKVHVALGYDAGKMIVVPNGYDFERMTADPGARAALREAWGIPRSALVIGCLGRFNPAKDYATFVRAAGLVAAEEPNAHFLMVGRGLTESNQSLTSWIRDTGVAERFHCVGERLDVPEVLSCMDIFCLSSRTEGFPNVVAEAMAMGLACVVTNVGDAAFLLGDSGRIVPPESPVALATGLIELVRLGEEGRKGLGAGARARVHSEFSIQRALERFDAVYAQVMGRGIA
jgi:glycosyltransferase involved in cell wall biosynthesis